MNNETWTTGQKKAHIDYCDPFSNSDLNSLQVKNIFFSMILIETVFFFLNSLCLPCSDYFKNILIIRDHTYLKEQPCKK